MRLTGFLMAFVCAASLLIVGQDDSASGVQSRIVALEKAWNQAYKLGDRKALDALLDDHIVLLNDDGSMQTKAEFLASINKSDSQEQQVNAGIDNRACVRKCRDSDRSIPSQRNRRWQALPSTRALC